MISYDPFNKPNKAYRTSSEAFKGTDYACSLEVTESNTPLVWYVILYLALVCVMILFGVLISSQGFPINR
jgi:hypothetical protein